MITQKLPEEIWRTCVDSIPIFGIDMISVDKVHDTITKGKGVLPESKVMGNYQAP